MNNIAFYRVKHGLTQKEFASKVNIAPHAVSYAERSHCGTKLAKKTAEVLGENVFEIMGADVLKILPQSEEDKEILIKIIKEL